MSVSSPLSQIEIAFTVRLAYETLHFAEAINKSAEPKLRKLGLANGAIENLIRVLDISRFEFWPRMYDFIEPMSVDVCPWESKTAFLKRDMELRDWIVRHGGKPADIEHFIYPGVAQ